MHFDWNIIITRNNIISHQSFISQGLQIFSVSVFNYMCCNFINFLLRFCPGILLAILVFSAKCMCTFMYRQSMANSFMWHYKNEHTRKLIQLPSAFFMRNLWTPVICIIYWKTIKRLDSHCSTNSTKTHLGKQGYYFFNKSFFPQTYRVLFEEKHQKRVDYSMLHTSWCGLVSILNRSFAMYATQFFTGTEVGGWRTETFPQHSLSGMKLVERWLLIGREGVMSGLCIFVTFNRILSASNLQFLPWEGIRRWSKTIIYSLSWQLNKVLLFIVHRGILYTGIFHLGGAS